MIDRSTPGMSFGPYANQTLYFPGVWRMTTLISLGNLVPNLTNLYGPEASKTISSNSTTGFDLSINSSNLACTLIACTCKSHSLIQRQSSRQQELANRRSLLAIPTPSSVQIFHMSLVNRLVDRSDWAVRRFFHPSTFRCISRTSFANLATS